MCTLQNPRRKVKTSQKSVLFEWASLKLYSPTHWKSSLLAYFIQCSLKTTDKRNPKNSFHICLSQLQCFNHRLLKPPLRKEGSYSPEHKANGRPAMNQILMTVFFIFLLSPGGFRQEFYIALFLGQFAFMYLVFDAILYRKKAGLIYRLTRNCSSKKGT